MFQANSFIYDNIDSTTMSVQYCRFLDNSNTENFISNRTINSENIQSGDKFRSFLYQVTKDPQEFQLEMYIENANDNKVREISRWLFKDNYASLSFDDSDRIYYIIAVGKATFTTNGTSGIISINCKTDSPYSYSPTISQTFDITTNKSITLTNNGDIALYPYFKITNRTANQTLTIKKIDQTEIGTVRGADSTHITLATSASLVDNFYNGMLINIMSGTGLNQNNVILDYVGSTRVATVSTWSVIPNTTSVYMIHIVEGTEQLTLSTNNYDGLILNEVITIDNETEEITWTGTNVNRYRNLSSDSFHFGLNVGQTSFSINGNIELEVSYQYRYLF